MSDQKQGSFCRCVFEMKVHFLDFTIVFAKDETNFAKDENPFAKDENDSHETQFAKDENNFPKDETQFAKDENDFPRTRLNSLRTRTILRRTI